MLRQYLTILLATVLAAATVNAVGCCVLPDPDGGCASTDDADGCAQAGGAWTGTPCGTTCGKLGE
ncbi:unnamed protein product [Cercospora beticola]|nr:unnamed protein product [Cercospora beticola]